MAANVVYKPKEAALLLRVSESTLRRMARKRVIRSINISPMGNDGRGLRFTQSHIDEFLINGPQRKEA